MLVLSATNHSSLGIHYPIIGMFTINDGLGFKVKKILQDPSIEHRKLSLDRNQCFNF